VTAHASPAECRDLMKSILQFNAKHRVLKMQFGGHDFVYVQVCSPICTIRSTQTIKGRYNQGTAATFLKQKILDGYFDIYFS
jgi:hypothetical protein